MVHTRSTPTKDGRSKSNLQTRLALRKSRASPAPTRVLRSSDAQLPPYSSNAQPSQRSRRRYRRSDPWAPKTKPKRTAPRPPPPTHLTCRICIELLPVSSFVKYRRFKHEPLGDSEIPLSCMRHLTRTPWTKKQEAVCRTCIGQAMAARHSMSGARAVSTGCLEHGCSTQWDSRSILRFFPAGEALEKYSEDMLLAFLHEAQVIACTNKDCGFRGLPEPPTPGFPHIVCPSPTCATHYCARCLVPWHAGSTCTEYQARHVNAAMTDPEKETLTLMQKRDGRRCPHCLLVIEKDGGCDNMFCEGCKKYFVWSMAPGAVLGSRVIDVPEMPNQGVVCEMEALQMMSRERAIGVAVDADLYGLGV